MKKSRRKPALSSNLGEPIWWLPIDSRLIPPIISFNHVKGLPRIFLIIEIILSSLIVIGTLIIAAIKVIINLLQ